MEWVTQVQIMVEAVSIPLCANIFAKGMNPSVLFSIMGKYQGYWVLLATRLGFASLKNWICVTSCQEGLGKDIFKKTYSFTEEGHQRVDMCLRWFSF